MIEEQGSSGERRLFRAATWIIAGPALVLIWIGFGMIGFVEKAEAAFAGRNDQ